MDLTQCNKALSKAKIALMRKESSAFFTTLCFSLKHLFDTETETACTDGTKVSYNPQFFMELTTDGQLFLLMHETMHVAYLHIDPARIGSRNPKKWNKACDHVINLQLIASGFKMPTGNHAGLADPAYKGMAVEQVYDLLPDENEDSPDPSGFGMDVVPSSLPSAELQEEVQNMIMRAAIQSKMSNDKPGTIPGEIQLFLDQLLEPKLPWNRILQKYLQAFSKSDFSFKKPNRRHWPANYLPSLYSQSLIDIAIAVDISGSVKDVEFSQFVSETHSILRMMRPSKISLIQFDTAIKSVDTVRSVAELSKIQFKGRGGTNIDPVLEWATANKPQLLLVFTDGGFYFGNVTTKVKTLWLIHDNKKFTAPFGKVIHYSMKNQKG